MLVRVLVSVQRNEKLQSYYKADLMKTAKLPMASARSPATGGPTTSASGTAVFTSAVSSIVKPSDRMCSVTYGKSVT